MQFVKEVWVWVCCPSGSHTGFPGEAGKRKVFRASHDDICAPTFAEQLQKQRMDDMQEPVSQGNFPQKARAVVSSYARRMQAKAARRASGNLAFVIDVWTRRGLEPGS